MFKLVEDLAPRRLAESWDNPGLQVGDPRSVVDRVMLALDVNIIVAAEAAQTGAGLIITHHPLFIKPCRSVRLDRPDGELLSYLLGNNITVYSAHTNLDNAAGGVNSVLAEMLGLKDVSVMSPAGRERYLKLAVYVPSGHVEEVRNALSGAGAGWIGNYSHCTFMTPGTGTFKPLEGTNPYIGRTGELERVAEYKLETIVPSGKADAVVRAMREAHPYEEAAYDLYPLENPGPVYGPGMVGSLPRPVTLRQCAAKVKEGLRLPVLRLGGALESDVQRIAVCGGSGADLWPEALKAGADVLVTGDVKYHAAQDMLAAGIKFIDAGHYGTEMAVMPALRGFLAERCRAAGMKVEIIISQVNNNPFTYL